LLRRATCYKGISTAEAITKWGTTVP
jgi:hypothetical protein